MIFHDSSGSLFRRHVRQLIAVSLLSIIATQSSSLLAQDEAAAPTATQEAEKADTFPDATKALPSAEEATRALEALAANDELDEAVKTVMTQHLTRTVEHLIAAEAAQKLTKQLADELATAPTEIPARQQALTAPLELPITVEQVAERNSLDELNQLLADCQGLQTTARDNLKKATDELARRASRRPEIPQLQADNKKQLAEVEAQLAAPDPEGEGTDGRQTRLLRYRARKYRLELEAQQFDQELRTYEVTTQLWTLRRDIADRKVSALDKVVNALQMRINSLKQAAAEKEVEDALQAVLDADPAVRFEAEQNAELAKDRLELLSDIEEKQTALNAREEELKQRVSDFEQLKKRAESSGFSPAIGVLLRKSQSDLPNARELEAEANNLQPEISKLNIRLIEWDAYRRQLLVDLDGQVIELVESVAEQSPEADRAKLEDEVRNVLSTRLTLFQELINNGNTQLERLVQLDTQLTLLSQQIALENKWLAEHVLWVRSAPWLGGTLRDYEPALSVLLNVSNWQIVALQITTYAKREWLWFVSMLVAGLFFLSVRGKLKRRVRDYGRMAQKSTAMEFRPTLATTFLTLCIALPLPVLTYLVGQRLEMVSQGHEFTRALGNALRFAAQLWGFLELIRMTAQAGGLGESHFNWGVQVTRSVRRFAHLMTGTLLPLGIVAAYLAGLDNELVDRTVGRVAFLGLMFTLSGGLYQLLRRDGPILQVVTASNPNSFLHRTVQIWPRAVVVSPLVLAVMSAVGYHYTAVQLTSRLAATLASLLAFLLVTEILMRWLVISYRRMAIQRARDRRQQQAGGSAEEGADVTVLLDANEPNLSDINDQTRQLIRLGGFCFVVLSFYLIWIDVLPALGFLNSFELWPNHMLTVGDEVPAVWITLADLLGAVLIAGLTFLASRNIPGLMEISVLRRLPLDAGARYAATSMTRYVIVLVGVVMCFRQIGIGWSSVQWLVAAMTVGLGFGLQEIFANFVSGIILLFERPIRVGDVVSIGSHSGAIVRIRIRATTLMDWDRKDVIIPNREFVTGQVVNWTLTNAATRLIIPVGIAYGSDVDTAERLLYQVAKENENVLTEPESMVVFSQFGDNTLNFELRTYCPLTVLLATRHSMHREIDRLFREHNIEIAFPQRDLHIKSMPEALSKQIQQTAEQEYPA